MIRAVTAYVPIPGHPRSEAEYHRLGKPLVQSDRVMFAKGDLAECWLYHYLYDRYLLDSSKFTYSVADNAQKNSLAYHIVQAQKAKWLYIASLVDQLSDVFVWLDYGILHVPGMTIDIINNFMTRADSEQAIAIPGCWDKDEFEYSDDWPCWRFCGGVMVVPREYIRPFEAAWRLEYINGLERTGNISWEVNVLARLEAHTDLPLWWYRADHDKTMCTNYRATEFADKLDMSNVTWGRQ